MIRRRRERCAVSAERLQPRHFDVMLPDRPRGDVPAIRADGPIATACPVLTRRLPSLTVLASKAAQATTDPSNLNSGLLARVGAIMRRHQREEDTGAGRRPHIGASVGSTRTAENRARCSLERRVRSSLAGSDASGPGSSRRAALLQNGGATTDGPNAQSIR